MHDPINTTSIIKLKKKRHVKEKESSNKMKQELCEMQGVGEHSIMEYKLKSRSRCPKRAASTLTFSLKELGCVIG